MLLLPHVSALRSRIYGFTARATLGLLWLIVAIETLGELSLKGHAPAVLDQPEVIQFLNKGINWYQQPALAQKNATTASDILFANSDRPTADQVLRLSFDFARAAAQLVNTSAASSSAISSTDSRYQTLEGPRQTGSTPTKTGNGSTW